MNQITAVLNHLQEQGNITSMEAIENYGATRLADIIFKLRRKGYNIETINCIGKTRYGTSCSFAKYVLHEER